LRKSHPQAIAPAVFILLFFGAGLATGLLRFTVPALVVLVPISIVLHTRRPTIALAGLIAILGSLSGALAHAVEGENCSSRLPAGRISLALRLVEPVPAEGGLATLVPVRKGCRGQVGARWPANRAGLPGDEWKVQGKWIPPAPGKGSRRGILIVSAAERAGSHPGISDRLRSLVIQTSARLYGERAPLVDALILNRRSTLDPALSEAYARSGLVHILSISGFHVGLIAGWLYLLCRLFRLSRSRALMAAAGLSTLYVAFLGWPAPATRAAALVVLLAVCRWRQRQVEPNSLLAVTCLAVLIIDPAAVFDLGAWLSASALWGATTFSRWTDRSLGSQPGWRTLGSSVGATLATAPLTAAALGSVALVGIVLNFAAIPLAALAVPGVLASVVLYPLLPGLGSALAAGSGAGLSLLDGIAVLGSRVPGGNVVQPVAVSSAIPWLLVLAFALWSLGRRNTLKVALLRWAWAGVVVTWGSLGWVLSPTGRDNGSVLTLHFLQVGQGDGAAIRTPGGHWVLIDAGPRFDGSDAGKRVVVPFLRRQGVRRLSAVIVSHVHADHLGGVPAVLERFPADVVMEPGDLSDDPRYLEFLSQLEAGGTRWHPGRWRDRFELDSVTFTVLHPDTTWSEWGRDLNEDSIVLLIEYRDFTALFTGDAGERAEPLLIARSGPVDLLKVGHHGSRTATSDALLERVAPRAAVISVGSNRYGHPSSAATGRLRSRGIPIWRTDQDGEVIVTTDGTTMSVCASRGCSRQSVGP
jgi:competence protein ComEC